MKKKPSGPQQNGQNQNAGPIPAKNYQTIIDLTENARPAKQLLQATKALRQTVLANRRDKVVSRSLTYSVKSSSLIVYGVTGHRQLAKKPNSVFKHDKKIVMIKEQTVSYKEETINARLTISTDDIYPLSMGYAFTQKKEQQCYHIWINQQPVTLIGVNYPQKVEYPPKLTDVLGILIAEQIRFNTLDLYHKAFPQIERLSTFELYESIFENFKEKIYNGWKHPWNKDLSEKWMYWASEFEIGWRLQQAQRANFRRLNQYEIFVANLGSQDQPTKIFLEDEWRQKEDQHIYAWMQGNYYKSQTEKLMELAKTAEDQRKSDLSKVQAQEIPINGVFIQGKKILTNQEKKQRNRQRKIEVQLLKAEGAREFEKVQAKFGELSINLYVEKLVKHREQPVAQ